jgi:hypothetical protein
VEQIAERRVVHLDAGAPVSLRLAIERKRVGALRDRDLRHERRTEARFVEHLRRPVRGDDGLAAATANLLLDVDWRSTRAGMSSYSSVVLPSPSGAKS